MAKALHFLSFIFILGCPCALSNQDKSQETWINLERYLLRNLKEYAEKLREKISVINSSVNEYLEEIEEAKEDPELYLANPLNSFRLIRHMHQDWVSWQIYMEKTVGEEEASNIERVLEKLPHEWDLQRAAEDVRIVTKFYNYEPAELVAQDERNSPIHLSPLDCYHLGLERYKEQDYKAAAKWLGVAAKNFSQSEYSDLYAQIGAPRWKMYRDYARALEKLNRREKYQAYEVATKLSPHNVHLMKEIGEMELLSLRDPLDPISDDVDRPTDVQEMCRGKKTPNENRLVCEYNNFVAPFLQLARMRLEEVISDPYTIMYPHSVYESEIEHMVNVYSRCPPNALFQLEEGVAVCSVSNGYSSVTKGLRERVLDMTGYNRDSDNFYIVAYNTLQPMEIFEKFRAYSQFSDVRFTKIEATAIIFLNDIPLGGALIFPDYKLDVFVQPKKGNVLAFDEKKLRTTICPNIAGHGLVMIKFLYQEE